MTHASPVFITGATGVVGSALIQRLREDGVRIRALTRRPSASLSQGVETIVGDLNDADALRHGLDGAGAVVHLAAQLHINDPSPELAGLYQRVNTEATEKLATLAGEAGVSRVVFTSTINVYGPSEGGAPWTEAHPTHPQSLYGQTKLDAEPSVLALPEGIVFRLAAVYGPGMKGNYPSLARLLRRGARVLPGDGLNRRTLIHVEDAVQALSLAATGKVSPGLYNLTDGRVHSFDAIIRSLQRVVGVREGVHYVPARFVRNVLAAPEWLSQWTGRRFPARALLDKLTEDVAVSGASLIETSPYHPRLSDLDDGWAASQL